MIFKSLFGFVIFVALSTCVNANARDVMGLFAPNAPVYVNVSDVKSAVQQLVNEVSDRLLCVQHGLEPSVCSKCLASKNILQILALEPNSKFLTRENAKDLSMLFLHHILEFRSLCKSEPYGCNDFHACQLEMLDIVRADDLEHSVDYVLMSIQDVFEHDPGNKCFGIEDILEEISQSESLDDKALVRQTVTIIMGHILKGQCIDFGMTTTAYLDDLFHMYGDHCSPVITVDGLKRLMSDLQNKGHQHDHNHDHSENEHDHNHLDHSDCPHDHSSHHHHHSHGEHDHSDREPNHFDHSHHSGSKLPNYNLESQEDLTKRKHHHDTKSYPHYHDSEVPRHHDDNEDHHHGSGDHHHDSEGPHNHDHSMHHHDSDPIHKTDNDGLNTMPNEGRSLNATQSHQHPDHSHHQHADHAHDVSEHNDTEHIHDHSDISHQLEHAHNHSDPTHQHDHPHDLSDLSQQHGHPHDHSDPSHQHDHPHDLSDPSHQHEHPHDLSDLSHQQDHSHDHSDPSHQHEHSHGFMDRNESSLYDHVDNFDEAGFNDSNETTAFTTPITDSLMNNNITSSNDTMDDLVPGSSSAFLHRSRRETSVDHQFRPPPVDTSFDVSTETGRSPSSALKNKLFHQESNSGQKDLDGMVDDVRKVYLLKSQGKHTETQLLDPSQDQKHANLASKCLEMEELVAQFRFTSNGSLSKDEFLQICPAIVQQVVSGACHRHPISQPKPNQFELYLYSCISVLIISMTSLAGVVLLPILTRQAYHYVMAGCYGLAFSTLAGDAFIHLMPQVLGAHSHGPDGHEHSHDENILFDPVMLKQLGIMASIYALYLFEAIVCAYSKDSHHSQEGKNHGHSHMPESLPKELTLISVKTKSETQLTLSRDSASSLDTEVVEENKKPANLMVSTPIFLGMTSLALVVTLGDSIHNFGDGLAIGAAFTSSIRGGLSTSIAVLCHELPHEFGDFVVLLSTGLSFSKALLINFLSGLTCFAGLFIGIVIGDDENARRWIMALTAGIFLYVALTELLPELKEHKKGSPTKTLLVKNFGMLAGVAIMVVISIYEHKISIDAF